MASGVKRSYMRFSMIGFGNIGSYLSPKSRHIYSGLEI